MSKKITIIAIALTLAILTAGYFGRSLFPSFFEHREIVTTKSPTAQPLLQSEYRGDLIKLMLEAKSATTNGIAESDWDNLTQEMSEAAKLIRADHSIAPDEDLLIDQVIQDMLATSTVLKGLDGCTNDPTSPGCFDQIAQILYQAGRLVTNPNYQPSANSDNPNRFSFFGSNNSDIDHYKSALSAEFEAKSVSSDKLDLVSEMLKVTGDKIDTYLTFVRSQ